MWILSILSMPVSLYAVSVAAIAASAVLRGINVAAGCHRHMTDGKWSTPCICHHSTSFHAPFLVWWPRRRRRSKFMNGGGGGLRGHGGAGVHDWKVPVLSAQVFMDGGTGVREWRSPCSAQVFMDGGGADIRGRGSARVRGMEVSVLSTLVRSQRTQDLCAGSRAGHPNDLVAEVESQLLALLHKLLRFQQRVDAS